MALQWGRRNYPAETRDLRLRLAAAGSASMGPPELPGGNRRDQPAVAARRPRFNGAAGITRRKPAARSTAGYPAVPASMGPPELPGGNRRHAPPQDTPLCLLQWGRRNYPAETCAVAVGTDPLPPELQWGRRNYPAETTRIPARHFLRRCCFNGAAGITRRKRDVTHSNTDTLLQASMGPPELPGGNIDSEAPVAPSASRLQWGRRNYPAETSTPRPRWRRPPAGFNGAAGITRRKLPVPQGEVRTVSVLQWGRRNYPAETSHHRASPCATESASMGPPELPGGNADPTLPSASLPARLQWGRRNYPAETCSERAAHPQHPCFNGAAGITRRKHAMRPRGWP